MDSKDNLEEILRRKVFLETLPEEWQLDEVIALVAITSKFGYKDVKDRLEKGLPAFPKREKFIRKEFIHDHTPNKQI